MNYILLIAIDKYDDGSFPTLNNAKLDAERFVKVMTDKYGFALVQEPLFDSEANRKNIVEALNSLSVFLTANDSIIIYFAGHGSINPKTKKGYWIPSDAAKSVSDYIPNSTVIDAIEGIEAKHILLISDSCFAGTFLTQTRAETDNHYSKLAEKKSRWLLASGREELVSDGQPGVGSPFAVSLNDFLEKNISKIFSLSELIVQVAKVTGSVTKQQPISAHIENVGHEGGQMVFELINEQIAEVQDIDLDLQRIVIPFDSAKELQKLGFPQKSIFGYYTLDKKTIVKKIDGAKNFVCSAFIFDEIIEFIPEEIEVDENTYVARLDGYDKLSKTELEYQYAEVTYQKTGTFETPYMSICKCNGRMVAFSITPERLYNNLIRWGKNQAETAALMLIALYNENKIKLNANS
jgi:hypothetical protein